MNKTPFENFKSSVEEYLIQRFPNLPKHELMDAASYIGYQAIILTNDMVCSMSQDWRELMRGTGRRYSEIRKERLEE